MTSKNTKPLVLTVFSRLGIAHLYDQSARPRSIRSRKPLTCAHNSAATSLSASGFPGPALTISCCWRDASQASRAAAILFASDMTVSPGLCPVRGRYARANSLGWLDRKSLVDHSIRLQPQGARQILGSFFCLFLAIDQENLRLPDRARALVFAFGDRRAKAGAGLLDRQADDHGSAPSPGPSLSLGSGRFSDRAIWDRASASHGSRTTRPRLTQGGPVGSLAS